MPTTFANTIDGNDIFAKRAECDAAGNDLSTTYATKSELPDGVPAVTSSDDGKVLKASYSGGTGSFSWETESGGGGSYTAGTGIDITNDVISVDTSVVATQTDLATKEDAFDVGTGLEMDTSGATPTLQVEAPVDIVAGPGIVIDNPDGNTLRVSTDENYETVLFEVADGSTGVTTATISEDITNFERVRFTVYRAEGSGLATQRIFEFPSVTTKFDMDAEMFNENGTYRALYLSRYEVSDLTVTNTIAKHYYASVSSNGYSGNGSEPLRLLKIVGVHRLANN